LTAVFALGVAACSSGSSSTNTSSGNNGSTASTGSGGSAATTPSSGSSSSPAAPSWKPSHDITFIVPYAAGGGSDAQARRLLAGMKDALGVNLRIVYKTGGGGAVGFLALKQSKPDGYTIANVVVPNIINTAQGKDVGYTVDEFKYVAMTETAPGALVVAKNSKFKTLKDFVDYAKANPGKVTIAGTGDTGKSAVAEIVKALDIKVTYVPVSAGVGAIVPDLVGGHVDAAEFAASHVLEHADQLIAIGLSGTDPSPALPDAPTLDSQGYKGFVAATSWGVMAPPGTPDNIVAALNAAIEHAVATDKVQSALKESGLTPMKTTPEQAKEYVDSWIKNVQTDKELLPLVGG
jgi:tripartite-type tricarboxylate transporter receptor subunit TctC